MHIYMHNFTAVGQSRFRHTSPTPIKGLDRDGRSRNPLLGCICPFPGSSYYYFRSHHLLERHILQRV
nr:unnamed protein product [Spirometra erinaceieuropaei]